MALLLTLMLHGLSPAVAAAPQEQVWPLRWGVDDAGMSRLLDQSPRAGELMQEFGFDLWVHHYWPPGAGEQTTVARNLDYIRRVDGWCREHDLDWIANLEHANWIKRMVDDQGRDWFNHPDGRHYFQFPDDLLEEMDRCERLLGLMYDEAAHMQNCRNQIAEVFKPFMYDPAGRQLEDAAGEFTAAAAAIGRHHEDYGLKLYTEHVFPVLFHPYARAGYVAATKILKENWSPAFIACAMGAALQYDTELWITPDLWGVNGYPSHSIEEYRSALLLAYHLGADCIYTENLAYDHENRGVGSLILLQGDDYTVTPYGEVTKWFRREYVPAHPRRYSFRQVRPRVAIVRQPDSDWGQTNSWLPNMLFGSEAWPSNPTTQAWLRLWNLLSRGVIAPESLSWHNAAYANRPYQVFCPLDGVVEFDHLVGEERLRDAEVIFLTGLGISADTSAAVERCVARGATCIALPHLLPARVRGHTGDQDAWEDGEGIWVATRDFLAPHVRPYVEPVIPQEDIIRYRFGDTTVTFRPVEGDMNRLEVEVREQ